jgi:hypothetical protein
VLDEGREGNLRWVTEDDGKRVVLTSEPEAGPIRRTKMLLTRLLPVDNLL